MRKSTLNYVDNQMKPTVSIIMPAFNASKYIRECIESVVHQDYGDWELIIIDDGSTDGTAEICNDFVFLDDRIKYIFQPNQGVAVARNAGLDMAIGRYIMFVDADDILSEKALSTFAKIAKKDYSIDLIRAEYEAVDSDGKKLFSSNNKVFNKKPYYEDDVNRFYTRYIKNDYFLWLIWIKTACIRSVRFVNGHTYMEDAEFLFHIMPNLRQCVYIPSVVYKYRKYENATSASLSKKKVNDVLSLVLALNNLRKLPPKGIDPSIYTNEINHCFDLVFSYLTEQDINKIEELEKELKISDKVRECTSVFRGSANMRDYLSKNTKEFIYSFSMRRKLLRYLRFLPTVVSKLKVSF